MSFVTKEDMKVNVGYVLRNINGMTIPAGTSVRPGRYHWNKDAFFVNDFSWLPEGYRNSKFFMGDVANYGVNVPAKNVIKVETGVNKAL